LSKKSSNLKARRLSV